MKPSIPSFTRAIAALTCTGALLACQTATIESCDTPRNLIGETGLPDRALHRLDQVPQTNAAREVLAADYLATFCESLVSHNIPGSRRKSHACTVTGAKEAKILIGAHYDKSIGGRGVADNWSGVVLATELLGYLAQHPPIHTFEFVVFGEEEPGMKGARAYLNMEARGSIVAMVNIDTLGLGPAFVDRRSDPVLKCIARNSGEALDIVVRSSNLRETTGDWQPFQRAGIRTLNFHSLNARNIRMIHSFRDQREAVIDRELQNSYRLILNALLALDQTSDS